MLGAIIFVVILVIILPVAILMSFGALAGIIGYLTKTSVDSDNVGEDGTETEQLTVAQANPWAGPTDDVEAIDAD